MIVRPRSTIHIGKLAAALSVVTHGGLDLARYVFQVLPVDGTGKVIVAIALRHRDLLSFFASLPKCIVGMQAWPSH